MRLGRVSLPERPHRARNIEVPQADRAEPVGLGVGRQREVDGELAGPVRVGRVGAGLLGDRDLRRLPVGGRG